MAGRAAKSTHSCRGITPPERLQLVAYAKNVEDYGQFTRRFFYENHDIKGFKTMVVV